MKYTFFFAILFSVFLMLLIVRKWKKKKEKMGCIVYGYIYLIIFSLSVLFFPFLGIIIKKIYDASTKPSYEATIVKYTSYEDRCKDSNDREYPCTKYISIVELQLEDGTIINKESNIHSGGTPTIGETVRVVYKKGEDTVDELSWKSLLLFVGLFIMLFFMGTALLAGLNYALDRSNKKLGEIFFKFLLYFVFPGAMIGFLSAFFWVLWKYFMGIEDYPLWVIAICSFFSTVLIFAMIGYLKKIFDRNKKTI